MPMPTGYRVEYRGQFESEQSASRRLLVLGIGVIAARRAKSLGVRSLPAIVVDGKLAGCCAGRVPDEYVLREALR